MAAVVLLHGLLLAAAWFARVDLPRREESALAVALLSAPTPVRQEELPAPVPVRLVAPLPAVLVDAPAVQLPVFDQRPAESAVVHTAPKGPAQAATETLATELAVQCPERAPPRYPPLAKRQREQGEVRLRVELDESGRIDRIAIVSSSGSPRLDEAARTAIESWRCRPAQHDGRPVRAVALQSLAFVLERR
ncbi:MAG TPA: TonB family protein [Caldimonas sp.]|nr:TonB family protein [Caldimonas sp.]